MASITDRKSMRFMSDAASGGTTYNGADYGLQDPSITLTQPALPTFTGHADLDTARASVEQTHKYIYIIGAVVAAVIIFLIIKMLKKK